MELVPTKATQPSDGDTIIREAAGEQEQEDARASEEEQQALLVAAVVADEHNGSSSSSTSKETNIARRRRWWWWCALCVLAILVAGPFLAQLGLAIVVEYFVQPSRTCGRHPRHVRLASGVDAARQMIVTFASTKSSPSCSSSPNNRPSAAPVSGGVRIGTTPDTVGERVVGEQDDSPTCYRSPVNFRGHGNTGLFNNVYSSPYYHHVLLDGLSPNTTYYYQPFVERSNFFTRFLSYFFFSSKGCPPPNRLRSFRTAPSPPSSNNNNNNNNAVAPISIAILADMGMNNHAPELLSKFNQSRDTFDSIILAGDVAYVGLEPRRWDSFLDFLDDYGILEEKPLQIVPGNHDIDKARDHGGIFLAYEHRFRMPRVRPAELGVYTGPDNYLSMESPPYPLPYEWGNAYYTYTHGPARFLMLSHYSDLEPHSTQYQWLLRELRDSIDRSVTPWVIVVVHAPLYNTYDKHQRDNMRARRQLEPLLIQYRVNWVFSGHVHAYQRTAPVVNGTVDARGPVHVTIGTGGHESRASFRSKQPEPWVGVRDAFYFGYGILRIVNQTHSIWEWIHTGQATDGREGNSFQNEILPPGPRTDRVVVENQYFLQE